MFGNVTFAEGFPSCVCFFFFFRGGKIGEREGTFGRAREEEGEVGV